MLLLQSTATATAAAAATPAGQPNSEPAASALAQGRLCAELAILADQAGEPEDETIKLYMAAAEHYDDALARIQSSYGMFIAFIVISIGITLSLASFVSNLLVGHSSRDDRVRLALKLKE